jgi:hypothetical protein
MMIFISFYIFFTNPCFQKSVPFQNITPQKEFSITLEARRVRDVKSDFFIYNLGKKEIIIYPKGFKAKRFIKFVREGRCSYTELVILKPVIRSPFNSKFTAH